MPPGPRAQEALSLYRAILRAAKGMPTDNRVGFIRAKTRHEYDKARGETDPEKIDFLLRLGWTQLDSIQVQAQHLTELAQMDMRPFKGVRNTVTLEDD
eukprot:tig00000157_g9700.t1